MAWERNNEQRDELTKGIVLHEATSHRVINRWMYIGKTVGEGGESYS